MEIIDIQSTKDADTQIVSVKIKNSSYVDANNITVSILKDSETGELISEQTLDILSSQTEKTLLFTIDTNSISTNNDFITLVGLVESKTAENNNGDNYQSFIVEKGSSSSTTNEMAYKINSVLAENGKIIANITQFKQQSGIIIAASYDNSGKLLDIAYNNISIPENELSSNQTLNLDFSNVQYISVYIIDNTVNLKPICKKFNKQL